MLSRPASLSFFESLHILINAKLRGQLGDFGNFLKQTNETQYNSVSHNITMTLKKYKSTRQCSSPL
jgi:hypothetical protein